MKEIMKKILIILTVTLLITLTTKGQNLFFIGENSYPSTETITLQANSDRYNINDLNILFAKDGTTGLFVVSTKTDTSVLISGKLIIYLDDGAVITWNDRVKYDYVNETAISVYHLTSEDLSKMKNSNINTVRYALKCFDCYSSYEEGNFSASNNGTPTKALITDFFGK
jgi:hypothetical protein